MAMVTTTTNIEPTRLRNRAENRPIEKTRLRGVGEVPFAEVMAEDDWLLDEARFAVVDSKERPPVKNWTARQVTLAVVAMGMAASLILLLL